jgi:hypothetical protein
VKGGTVVKFDGAVVKEQGVTFGIAVVKPNVIQSSADRTKVQRSFATQVFQGLPVVLMAQNSRGTPTYWGRPDIVRFLANVPMAAIPWKQYTLN